MGDTVVEKRISPHNVEKKDSAYKRSNKPFMEKKRRARINNCLGQLKTLVLQAMRKDTNQYSKLEKADILEMTVKHLRQLQRQHVTQAISHDPTVATKYKAGFNECANEVVRYLSNVHGVEDTVRNKLINHLGNVVSTVNHSENSHQQCQPLNVQIPQQVNQGLSSVPSGCLLMPAGVQASPLVIQQQVQNVSNSYTQGHNTQSLQQRNHGHQTQFCGSFQIVPNSSSPGAVAVYLGQAQNVPQNVQTSPVAATNHAVPLYSTHTPPRTKASLKAFDSSAFSQVSGSANSSPSCSPSSQESFLPSNLDLQIHGLDVKCGRTPSPLKMEDVWRPW